ncbi:MAG: prolipoprotein diacylglyceryl transferase [Haliea sp.]|nr:prolipoprotein diacylglyceryl transferase [Haliea sp.]
MYPQGLFGIEALQLLISPIAVFGILFFILYLRQDGIRSGRAVALLLLIAVFAFLGAKLFSLYVRGWELYQPLSGELRGGLRYPGAVIAILITGPLLKRWLLPELPLARFLDVLAITVCFAFALVRFSCWMNGCCTGPPCSGIFCLSYAPGSQVWYAHLQHGLLESAAHRSLRYCRCTSCSWRHRLASACSCCGSTAGAALTGRSRCSTWCCTMARRVCWSRSAIRTWRSCS